MKSILLQNLNTNFNRATRGLNKPVSRQAGFSLFGALRPESNGRFSVGVLRIVMKFFSLQNKLKNFNNYGRLHFL